MENRNCNLFGMAVLMLINAGVSLLGVSVLLPFIQAVMSPDELLQNPYIRKGYDLLGLDNTNQLVIALAVLIMIVYAAKNAFIIFMNNMQYRFPIMENRKCRIA